MGNRNPFAWILALLVMAVFLLVLFPPLLLILLAAGIWFRFRLGRLKKQMENEQRDLQSGFGSTSTESPEPTVQDDLFRQQISRLRNENAEVIDVEFTPKDSGEEEKQSV